MDPLVCLARRDLLESLAHLEHLDLLGLRVSWELRDSMVFLAPEVTVVFLVAPVLLVNLVELVLLVPLVPVAPLATLACPV